MFINNFCVVVSVILVEFLIRRVRASGPYAVPDPKIEIFKKGWFRFSIPDEEGVELFAFHGNINVPMRGIEAGDFSRDIVRKCGDFWVFEDKNEKLIIGDTIYFWLFVIKNRLGYRYDDGHFVVKETSEYKPLICDEPPKRKNPSDVWTYEPESTSEHNPIFDVRHSRAPTPTQASILAPNEKKEDGDVQVCCDLFLNVSYRIISVAEENKKLIDQNDILYQLVQRDDHNARTMKIYGKYPTKYHPTPRDFAQNLIKDKLLLDDVKVTEGELISDGISFKVESLSDKVKVILAAKKGLQGSFYSLSW